MCNNIRERIRRIIDGYLEERDGKKSETVLSLDDVRGLLKKRKEKSPDNNIEDILTKHIHLLSQAIEEAITQENENIPEPRKLRLDGVILEAEDRLSQLISISAQLQSTTWIKEILGKQIQFLSEMFEENDISFTEGQEKVYAFLYDFLKIAIAVH